MPASMNPVSSSVHSSGIDVYVLDTGVYAEHLDFGGRASHSANMIKHEDNTDMGGHGKLPSKEKLFCSLITPCLKVRTFRARSLD